MMLVIMSVACSKQQNEDKTGSTSDQYEIIRQEAAAILRENPDSTFAMLDSLEATDQYPECVINLLRGNMYGQMMSLRFAEFYLRKAIGEELHDEWPKGYYMGIYNLGLSLQVSQALGQSECSQGAHGGRAEHRTQYPDVDGAQPIPRLQGP